MSIQPLREEVARLEEGVLHYEDSNRIVAEGWRRVANVLGFGAALTGAVTASLNLQDRSPAVSAATAVATAGLAAALAFFRPQEREAANRRAAADLNILRLALRRFRNIQCIDDNADAASIHNQFHELVRRRDELVPGCTDYSARAFRRAQRRIARGTFSYEADANATGDT